ncbi:MAG: LTA synthase family protein [Fibrobacter sp.]|uniref:LTA synthase family protein n=1 Tax=Fibrobacter sp. TaxID=35828 RepID=UPI0025C0CE49|nr:LTA synthase family protein [Fibrobacter sp.]MBQ7078184.1 LTA synthase family protein [Fibrobacter sp.]
MILSAVGAAACAGTLKKRLLALVLAPVVLYIFFYDYDYGLLGGPFPLVLSYVGGAFAVFLSLLTTSFCRSSAKEDYASHPLIKIFLSEFVVYLILFIIFTIPWAIDTFPLSNVEAVLFTVFAGENEGAEEFVISSFMEKVFFPVLWIFAVGLLVQIALSLVMVKWNLFYEIKLRRFRLSFNCRGVLPLLWQIQKALLMVFGIYAVILLLVLPGIVMSAPFKALIQQPVDSEFYRENYVHPDSVKIIAQDEPKNLVVIFLESMEKNFAHHTPEIVRLEKSSLDFLPGGQDVSGTSWTIAALTGKLCSIPLNMPMGIEEYLGKLPTYVPYAKCLMNVLADRKYNQLYIQGTSGEFTQKNDFWKAHGNVKVHDIKYYKSVGKIPEDYHVFWGFEDRKLFRLAKEELDSLANLDKPFAFYMLTVDTHLPRGWLDDSCRIALKSIGITDIKLNHFPEALRCASMQLESFITWIRVQPWFERTVIFVMGDHTSPFLSTKAGLPQSENLHWTNFGINLPIDKAKAYRPGRAYSSLDMFPTILESMGFELENHAVALGRSLYADSPTLLEKYGQKALDSLLRERSIQYDYFLMGR